MMINPLRALLIMPFKTKIFSPNKIFKNKRVAVVGPADSALQQELGNFINSFDLVIRLNKSLVTFNRDNIKFIGTKTDVLFHNFHENMDTGGAGPIDWKLFDSFGLQYLLQSRFDWNGWRNIFNYFKKYLNTKKSVYILPKGHYEDIKNMFGEFHPTRGFCALYSALNSECDEVFITGFTFFKTPYANGYRDNIREVDKNMQHIQNQGLHNVELEFENFIKVAGTTKAKKIFVDPVLYQILKDDQRCDMQKFTELNGESININPKLY